MAQRAGALTAELSAAKREIDVLNGKLAAGKLDSLLAGAKSVGAVRLVTADLGETALDAVRSLCDALRDKAPDAVAVFAAVNGGKLNFVSACGKDAVSHGAHAGNLLKAVSAITGGKGGGRPDSATSGGRDLDKIPDALAAATEILGAMLK